MLDTNGYSLEIERENRENEQKDGTDQVMLPRELGNTTYVDNSTSSTNNKVGRPEKEDDERTSDPEAAVRGKQPKPSNPEGSMDDET